MLKETEYPIVSDSWTILTPNVFIKSMDRSSFLHHGTAIPRNVRQFFNIDEIVQGQRIDVALVFMDIKYEAYFSMDIQDIPRTRLFWKSDFSSLIHERLPEWYDHFSKDKSAISQAPEMRFHKRDDIPDVLFVDFIYPSEIALDLDHDVEGDSNHNIEGSYKYFYSKKYERNPENRRKAVEIHGTVCAICGFDFEKHYGIRGRGFIEIHHTTPLHSLEEEIYVNPATDLIPVCSNCHRMIHRRRNHILSIDEMINIFHTA